MSTDLQKFNWVKARSECSLLAIFSALHTGVVEDVEYINSRRMEIYNGFLAATIRVDINSRGDLFMVSEEGNPNTQIRFNRHDSGILVKTPERDYLLTPRLTDEGTCKLSIDSGQETYEQWQVRRRILEDLFFGNGRHMPTPKPSVLGT